ncbi:Calx-beta domain-containing protein, partial [Microcoleus sp. AT9_B4]
EGNHTSTINYTATSTDTNYNAIAITPVTANITDNDVASVNITQSAGSTDISEGSTTDSYTVVLNSQPTNDVTININPDSQSTSSTNSLTFTSANWNVPQTVTVTAVDDNLVEGNHTSTINYTANSSDVNYDAISITPVTANITDNDTASVNITQSSGSTDITEGGVTDSYTVVLNSQPTSNVTININPDSQSTSSASTLTFTSANWNTPQTVTVTALDDNLAEGNHNSTINYTASSSDTNYHAISITPITANITDNDVASVNITQSAGSTDISEGSTTDSYTVVLTSQPTSDVTININPDSQSTSSASTLTFTSANWNTPQTVTVTALDDNLVEGNHTSTINYTANSSDVNYDAISITPVTANITDNDTANVNITQSGGSTNVSEGGVTDSYTVVLNSQPTNDVTININPDSQSTSSTNSLTFTSANWNVPQTVTVTAVDDNLVEGNHNSTINYTASSSDTNYNAISITPITANITDNDVASVNITQSAGSTDITEGSATDSYTVVLTSQPTSNVTININPDSQSTSSASTLTFTSANWNTPQTVTLTALDDNLAEGNHNSTISYTASSSDTNYNAISITPVTANITDNDVASVNITQSAGSTDISEGSTTDSYTVVLNSQPTNDVTININPDSQSTSSTNSLTFTSANWNVPQTVTVTAVDDSLAEGNHNSTISYTASSSDVNYDAISITPVTANITDNDTANVNITQSGGSTNVSEGGVTDSYTVVLNSQPTNDVTININPDSQSTSSTNSLTFTSANWNVPQTVTVTAVNDNLVEGNHNSTISYTASSSDVNYDAISITPITANITDNDVASVNITQSAGSTDISEGSTTDSYTVVLTSQPTSDVTININPDSQSTSSTNSLTFTSANWNVPQIVTVTAVDDNLVEGNHNSTINYTASSSDTNYHAISITPITANITDNDVASVNITQSSGSTDITEGGATDSYTVVLNSQPTSNVTININPDSQSTSSASTLTFTSANWNVPQSVTVTAVDDNLAEGNHTSTINYTASSSDVNYDAISIASITANITDNDVAPNPTVNLSVSSNVGNEAGTTAITVTATTSSAVSSNQTVNLGISGTNITTGDYNLGDTSITIPSGQTTGITTFTIIDDALVEGTETATLTISNPTSGITLGSTTFQDIVITDNDTPTPTPTPIPIPTPSVTPTPIPTPSVTPTPIPTPSVTPTPIPTPTPSVTPIPTPTPSVTPTPIPTPSVTPTPIPTPTPSVTPTPIPTPTPSVTPTPIPSVTPTPIPTPTPSVTPTPIPSVIPTPIPTPTPSVTPTPSLTPTPTPSVTPTPTPITNNIPNDDCICDDIVYPNLNQPNSVANTIIGVSSIQIGTSQNDKFLGSNTGNIFDAKSGDDNLYGGDSSDILNGNTGNDFISGGTGDDILFGDQNNDIILGNLGNDLIFGGKGNDSINSREGDDIVYANRNDDFIDGGKDNDTLFAGKGNDIVLGSQGDDYLFGNQGSDTICGGVGNDLISGDESADILGGCEGNDTLYGGEDNDTLIGCQGDDILYGDRGNDSLIGGSGNDIFVLTTGQGFDTIADFTVGQDSIALTGGLSFSQLAITQNTQGTLIKNLLTGEELGVMMGVSANAITSANFRLI